MLAVVLGLAAAIFLAISVYQSVQINGFLGFDGLKDKLEDCARDRNELRAISNEKNEQAERTKEIIRIVEREERSAKSIADKIREAPNPPNCETPGIDILRNEI